MVGKFLHQDILFLNYQRLIARIKKVLADWTLIQIIFSRYTEIKLGIFPKKTNSIYLTIPLFLFQCLFSSWEPWQLISDVLVAISYTVEFSKTERNALQWSRVVSWEGVVGPPKSRLPTWANELCKLFGWRGILQECTAS